MLLQKLKNWNEELGNYCGEWRGLAVSLEGSRDQIPVVLFLFLFSDAFLLYPLSSLYEDDNARCMQKKEELKGKNRKAIQDEKMTIERETFAFSSQFKKCQ